MVLRFAPSEKWDKQQKIIIKYPSSTLLKYTIKDMNRTGKKVVRCPLFIISYPVPSSLQQLRPSKVFMRLNGSEWNGSERIGMLGWDRKKCFHDKRQRREKYSHFAISLTLIIFVGKYG